MSRATVAVLALLSLPLAARAQEGLGLDLSDETEAPLQEETQEAAPPPAAPVTAAPPAAGAPATGSFREAEREVTLDDRVKSVQRKVYLKRHRFELAPLFAFSVNDPYYAKLGAAVRGGYYLADTLALSGRMSLYQVLPSDDVRTAKRVYQSRIFHSVPQWSAMGDVEWSPIYGKVAFLNDILHFDAYVLGGLGVVNTAASSQEGPRAAADLGVGARFVARDFLAVNVALINTTYVDQPAGTTKGATQNLMTINAGVSIFFPFTSTGKESE